MRCHLYHLLQQNTNKNCKISFLRDTFNHKVIKDDCFGKGASYLKSMNLKNISILNAEQKRKIFSNSYYEMINSDDENIRNKVLLVH